MFCTKCGNRIDKETKFCTKCGASVNGKGTDSKGLEISFDKTEILSVSDGADITVSKKQRKINRLFLFLILILAGIVGFSIYDLVYQRNEESGDSDDRYSVAGEDVGEKDIPPKEKIIEMEQAEIIQEVYTGDRQDINLEIHQVDNSHFPKVTFYASVTDENGQVVNDLDKTDFRVQEIDTNGNVLDAELQDVYKVIDSNERISINLVLDASSSMLMSNKMEQAQNAAVALMENMNLEGGDRVGVLSFSDFVYLEQDFTNQKDLLNKAIYGISNENLTALYDGLYAGLYQTYYEDGIRCVIAFTDGMENCSSYTFDDVVNLAHNTGIPVFIIGIGDGYDAYELQNLAQACSGKYYSASVNELEMILEDIYVSIYQEQQDYYTFTYTTSNLEDMESFRDIVLSTSETTEFYGTYTKEYVPQSDISGAFSNTYMNRDFIFDFTSQREVIEADLAGLSLAELRIARNEIFARHGRQFKDSMLNQWFYQKDWYLNLSTKYTPDYFDMAEPSPLSDLEQYNTQFILTYEQQIMSTQDIYPNASTVLLSDYDLSLSRAVLKSALAQVQSYDETDIRNQNIIRIQEAIDKEDVSY